MAYNRIDGNVAVVVHAFDDIRWGCDRRRRIDHYRVVNATIWLAGSTRRQARPAEANVAAALRSEKEKRYLAIVQNIEGLYSKTQDPARKAEFLKAARDLWLLGDQELVRKLRVFLVDLAGNTDVDAREQLFGDVILDMRNGLGLPTDQLSNEDFRFHSP